MKHIQNIIKLCNDSQLTRSEHDCMETRYQHRAWHGLQNDSAVSAKQKFDETAKQYEAVRKQWNAAEALQQQQQRDISNDSRTELADREASAPTAARNRQQQLQQQQHLHQQPPPETQEYAISRCHTQKSAPLLQNLRVRTPRNGSGSTEALL